MRDFLYLDREDEDVQGSILTFRHNDVLIEHIYHQAHQPNVEVAFTLFGLDWEQFEFLRRLYTESPPLAVRVDHWNISLMIKPAQIIQMSAKFDDCTCDLQVKGIYHKGYGLDGFQHREGQIKECPDCKGSGTYRGFTEVGVCRKCDGAGEVKV